MVIQHTSPRALRSAVLCLAAAATLHGAEFAGARLGRQLRSPHTPFARPYVRGRVTALVVAPTWTQRETVELAQRLSLDYTPLMTAGYADFGPYDGKGEKGYAATAPEEFRAAVDRVLNPDRAYETIIIGKMKWYACPAPVTEELLRRVRAGTGLVYVGPWGRLPDDLEGAVSADHDGVARVRRGLPSFAHAPRLDTGTDAPQVLTGTLGKGRVVVVDYGEDDQTVEPRQWGLMLECLTPFASDDPLYYDYWHSLLARAALWTAKLTFTVRITGLPEAGIVAAQEQTDGTTLRLTLKGDLPRHQPCFVHWVIRDRRGIVEHMQTAPCSAAPFKLALPFLKAGEKVLDVWLRDGHAQVLDWASTSVSVRAAAGINALVLNRDILRPDDALAGSVRLTAALGAGDRVRLEVRDTLRRLVAATEAKPAGNRECSFSLSVPHPLTRAYTALAQLVRGDRVIDEAAQRFFINTTDFSEIVRDFTFHIWDGPRPQCRSTRTWLTEFARLGIDTVYVAPALFTKPEVSAQVARMLAEADLMAAPYATRIMLASSRYLHTKPVEGPDGPELNRTQRLLAKTLDELRTLGNVRRLEELATAYGPLGPAYYSLGDENALCLPPYRDVCFSAEVRQSFQEYLQTLYPDLAALNAEWGTDFESWDAVKAIALKDAAAKDQIPRWIDHRMHMDRLFTQLHARCTQTIRDIDPVAKVGIEGIVYPSSSFTGFNLYEMLPTMEFFSPYNHLPEIHAFGFLPGESMRGTWFGSYQGATEAQVRYLPWHMLFEGANSISWWHSRLGGSAGLGGLAGFCPDLGPQPLLAHAAEEVLEIKAGIGKLLLAGERVVPPIAVYYSNACLHASTARPVETTWEHSLIDIHYVLRDAGFEYGFLAPPHLLSRQLRNAKVLILPYSQAIADAEVKLIAEFVQNGGLLVADFAPATMTGHGKARGGSALQEVFGKFERLHVQRLGKGHAVYLADYVKGYHTRRKKGLARGVCDGVVRLLRDLAGLQPFARVTDPAGNTRQDIEISQFRHGDARYLALLRVLSGSSKGQAQAAGPEGEIAGGSSGGGPDVAIALPTPAHVYAVRTGEYLGRTAKIATRFAPAEARLYALLPARVEALQMVVARETYRPGESVVLTGSLAPNALATCGAVVRIEALHNGVPLPHYTAKVEFRGKFTHTIPLALNEAPGTYTVRATDVASSKCGQATFEVR